MQHGASVETLRYARIGLISDVPPCIHVYLVHFDFLQLDFLERGKREKYQEGPKRNICSQKYYSRKKQHIVSEYTY